PGASPKSAARRPPAHGSPQWEKNLRSPRGYRLASVQKRPPDPHGHSPLRYIPARFAQNPEEFQYQKWPVEWSKKSQEPPPPAAAPPPSSARSECLHRNSR